MSTPAQLRLRVELSLLLRSRMAQLTLALFVLVNAAACTIGVVTARQQQRTLARLAAAQQEAQEQAVNTAAREDRRELKLGQFRDPRDPANYVRIVLAAPAVRLPLPASGMVASQAARLPFYFALNTGSQAKTITSYEYTNPELLRTGGFDMAFVVLYILPVVLIILGHGVWTSDRGLSNERLVALGTEGAQKTYLRQLMLASSLPVLLSIAAGWFVIAVAAGNAAPKLLAGLSFVLITVLYALFWLGTEALVIRAASSPAASLAVLLSVFTVCVVLVPSVALWSAVNAHPQPSRADYLDRTRQISDRIAHDLPTLSQAYAQSHPELDMESRKVPAAALPIITAALTDAASQPLAEGIELNLQKQQASLQHWFIVSPVLLTSSMLDRLGGVDEQSQADFVHQATKYVSQLRGFFLPILLRPTSFDKGLVQQLNGFPPFQQPVKTRALLRVSDLLCWLLPFGLLGWLWFRNVFVRVTL